MSFDASVRFFYKAQAALAMVTWSNENIFLVTGHLCGEWTGHRWILPIKASDAELWYFFDLRLNKQLNKESWGWWFETPSYLLWGHCNVMIICIYFRYLGTGNRSYHMVSDNGLSPAWCEIMIRISDCLLLFGFGNKFMWNLNQNTKVFIKENVFGNDVCKMGAILPQPLCTR